MELASLTHSIRIDAATRRGSVIDVIQAMSPGQTRQSATEAIKSLKLTRPELSTRIQLVRINHKGRLTPVADFGTLVHIIFCMPGKTAMNFRARSAHQVCRLMGGDTRIIAEVQARNDWWQETPEKRQVQQALLAPPPVRGDSDPSEDTTRERDVRDDLALSLNGRIEFETPVGFADVVTDTHVIEVKHWKQWKHALGQVLAYQAFASDKRMCIHLVADECDRVAAQSTVTIATGVCAKYNVSVTLEVRTNDSRPSKKAKIDL